MPFTIILNSSPGTDALLTEVQGCRSSRGWLGGGYVGHLPTVTVRPARWVDSAEVPAVADFVVK
jgi:hypothetical protein